MLVFKKEFETVSRITCWNNQVKTKTTKESKKLNNNQGWSKQNDELEQTKTTETLSNRPLIKPFSPLKPIKKTSNYRAPESKKNKGLPSKVDKGVVKSDNKNKNVEVILNEIKMCDVSSLNNEAQSAEIKVSFSIPSSGISQSNNLAKSQSKIDKHTDKYIDKPKKNNIYKTKQQAKDNAKKEDVKVKQNKQLINSKHCEERKRKETE